MYVTSNDHVQDTNDLTQCACHTCNHMCNYMCMVSLTLEREPMPCIVPSMGQWPRTECTWSQYPHLETSGRISETANYLVYCLRNLELGASDIYCPHLWSQWPRLGHMLPPMCRESLTSDRVSATSKNNEYGLCDLEQGAIALNCPHIWSQWPRKGYIYDPSVLH